MITWFSEKMLIFNICKRFLMPNVMDGIYATIPLPHRIRRAKNAGLQNLSFNLDKTKCLWLSFMRIFMYLCMCLRIVNNSEAWFIFTKISRPHIKIPAKPPSRGKNMIILTKRSASDFPLFDIAWRLRVVNHIDA